MENWNSANHDLFYGKDGDLTGSAKESQEVSMLALHLGTRTGPAALADRRLTDADRGTLSPLFWTHVNPYGRFELDMNSHLVLVAAASMVPGPAPRPRRKPPRSAAEGAAGAAS